MSVQSSRLRIFLGCVVNANDVVIETNGSIAASELILRLPDIEEGLNGLQPNARVYGAEATTACRDPRVIFDIDDARD